MLRRSLPLLAALSGLGGCAERAALPATPRGGSEALDEASSDHGQGHARAPVAADVVERAAAPFIGQRTEGGELLPSDQLLDVLSRADLVCVGEEHDDPSSHFAELVVLTGLWERSPMNGREVGLGLEMVARPEQPLLDSFARRELDEKHFLEESRWAERWGWDFAYYRPQLQLALRNNIPLIALNSPRPLTRRIARGGLSALTRDELKTLPELDLADAEHRAWFDESTRAHPHGDPDHMYAAQVVWDETMAESAVRWLGGKLPGRQLVIFAGTGHCRDEAIPKRVRRRSPAQVVSVRALRGMDEKSARETSAGFDFVMRFQAKSE
ncbi:MAG: ChaN family lipoprotein [Myxococcales bacterium]|nr:ChaN family lipoprotein [Myxococcales bacterium]